MLLVAPQTMHFQFSRSTLYVAILTSLFGLFGRVVKRANGTELSRAAAGGVGWSEWLGRLLPWIEGPHNRHDNPSDATLAPFASIKANIVDEETGSVRAVRRTPKVNLDRLANVGTHIKAGRDPHIGWATIA